MNRATIIMVVLAALTVLGAYVMAPADIQEVAFEDTGQPLFAEFQDPNAATSLEVIEWDEKEATVKRFKVEFKDGRWVIPSHNDYPADAAEHMGKAAASFIDVKRDIYYGDKAEEHASFGVLDPQDSESEGAGKGKRIVLEDSSGTSLVDIIVGQEIPDKDGFYYVRFPGQKRVYGARMELDISTEFTKWIEKDLLLLEPKDVVALVYDPYRVDEARGQVVETQPLVAERDTSKAEPGRGDWKLAEGMAVPPGKEFDAYKMASMLDAIDGLQIVGVRPRPNPLTLAALQSKGFFVTPDGSRLFGNEGEVRAISKDGVTYTLYFGEVTLDSGLALTAGTGENPGSDTPGKDGSANRYLFVDVTYDATVDPDATKDATTGADQETGADAATPDAAADKATDRSSESRAKVKRLRERFDAWFYVISDDSFKRIHKPRDEFFKDIEPEK